MNICNEDRSKIDTTLNKYVFIKHTSGIKGFKLWDLVSNNMVIHKDVVFDEQFILR